MHLESRGTQARLNELLEKLPSLSDKGVNSKDAVNNRNDLQDIDKLNKIIDWLGDHARPSTSSYISSYYLKHQVEKVVGYTPNGTLIAAAIIAGYPYRTPEHKSPNLHFGLRLQK